MTTDIWVGSNHFTCTKFYVWIHGCEYLENNCKFHIMGSYYLLPYFYILNFDIIHKNDTKVLAMSKMTQIHSHINLIYSYVLFGKLWR